MMVKTIKDIFTEAASLNDYLSSRGINPKFVSRDTKISHAKSAEFQKWKNDRKMMEEIVTEASETELLAKYLNSRGINPKYATKDMKIAHSKSGQFQKWKRDHQHDELNEETDEVDTITVDIPLMIRLLELAREDVKTDMELHKITERLIEIRGKGMLSMEDYDFIANGKAKIKEEVLDESPKEGGKRKFSGMYDPAPKGTFAYDQAMRKKKHDEIEKNQSKDGSGMTSAINRLEKHLNKEEVVTEMDKSQDAPGRDTEHKLGGKEYTGTPVKAKKFHTGVLKSLNKAFKKPTSENTLDSMAATESPCDCSDNTNSTPTTGKSYAAKMVKGLKKTVKEETYYWEKDDKSSQEKSYGKAPKINVTDKKGTLGDTKPEARVVMKGGKTLTGQPRDMVEIDPSMKQRPGQQDKGQNTFTNPIAKKSPNFN